MIEPRVIEPSLPSALARVSHSVQGLRAGAGGGVESRRVKALSSISRRFPELFSPQAAMSVVRRAANGNAEFLRVVPGEAEGGAVRFSFENVSRRGPHASRSSLREFTRP